MKKIRDRDPISHAFLRVLHLTVLISFVITALTADRLPPLFGHRDPDEYRLIALQSALGALASVLPLLLEWLFGIRPPKRLSLLYLLFLFGSIFLGEAMGFYYRFTHWDDLLHLVSGVMLTVVGFYLARTLSKGRTAPLFSAIFAFSFALSLGAVWEIYEYICDGSLGINMQKFADGSAIGEGLVPLVGRAALCDTMQDLTVDFSAALGSAVTGFLLLRQKSNEDTVKTKATDCSDIPEIAGGFNAPETAETSGKPKAADTSDKPQAADGSAPPNDNDN